MAVSSPPDHVFDREFLPLRHRLLDVAAGLDRIARSGQASPPDPRMEQITAAIQILAQPGTDHAQRIQEAFALPYEEGWRAKFGLTEG